jgi:uncharacterized membrane protein YhfC
MNVLEFVRGPDWRSVVLALALIAPWLALLSGRRLGRLSAWAALVAAALLFPPSIAWVQAPLQQAINVLYLRLLTTDTLTRWTLLLGVPVVLMSGLVQETVKLAVAAFALRRTDDEHVARAGLALGAASGAGYGGAEAFWAFNQIFGAGFAWATVQMVGPIALLGFVERFFAVMFHIGVSSVAAYGYATGRRWRFLVLAIALHTLANYGVLLVQADLLSRVGVEVWGGIIGVATMTGALVMRARARGT